MLKLPLINGVSYLHRSAFVFTCRALGSASAVHAGGGAITTPLNVQRRHRGWPLGDHSCSGGHQEADTLVLESTYGDRRIDHEHREEELAAAVSKVISRGGTLVIPAFAVGRTQDILLSLYRLRTRKKIPTCPIYLDSPMANKVTDLYARYIDDLLVSAQENDLEVALSPDFFQPVESPDDSMLLCMSTEPKIVISASGMLQGGRVLHHLKTKLPDRKSGVLFAGFQGNETKGRLLVEGIMSLRIHQEVPVEAEILICKDLHPCRRRRDDQWLELFKNSRRLFFNHGETGLNAFAARLKERFAAKVVFPAWREEFSLSPRLISNH